MIVKDVILLLIGAAVVGMMYRNVTIDKTPLLLFTAALVYSLCVGLAFLPTFGHEKQVGAVRERRERVDRESRERVRQVKERQSRDRLCER